MALTNFNDENIYTYFAKAEQFGASIYHVEEGEEIWDDAYASLEVAEKVAMAMTLRDPQRAADAKERNQRSLERLRASMPSSPYYSITGYYGD